MIHAHEVRKGETAYTDDNGITQMLMIDLNAPLMATGNEDKEIRIILPKHANEVAKIYCLNVTHKEKDAAFDMLDLALHDEAETMKAKEKKIEQLEAQIEALYEGICSLEGHISKLERRVG
jgi:hypothetical protein